LALTTSFAPGKIPVEQCKLSQTYRQTSNTSANIKRFRKHQNTLINIKRFRKHQNLLQTSNASANIKGFLDII